MLEKFNEYLFDFLGLFFPGLLFLILLFLPFINPSTITIFLKNNKYIHDYAFLLILLIVIFAYIFGHAIKVFSKLQYEIFALFSDELFLYLIKNGRKKLRKKLKEKEEEEVSNEKKQSFIDSSINIKSFFELFIFVIDFFIKYFLKLFVFVIDLIIKILSFKVNNYTISEKLYSKTKNLLNDKLDISVDKWYELYKISTTIMYQEKIDTLTTNFLAKYNLYRSLAFIFLLNQFYIFIMRQHCNNTFFITYTIVNFCFWFTYHDKYKRYWMLCGNEAIYNLLYYLTKNNGVKK